MTGRRFQLEWLVPAGLAAAYVLVKFEAIPTPLGGLVRPLTIAVLAAVALQLTASLMLRSASRGSLIAGAAVLAIVRLWPLALIVLAVLGAVILLERRRNLDSGVSPAALIVAGTPSGLGLMALILVVVSAVPIPSRMAAGQDTGDASPIDIPAEARRPDIFVVILDGYPGTSLLAETFGYDNAGFDRDLASLGFELAPTSRSNYTSTWASLASFLNMQYLDELRGLEGIPAEPAPQHRALMSAIEQSTGIALLREAGYRIVTVPSPFESTSLSSADTVHSPGSPTAFEHALIQDTIVAGTLEIMAPRLLTELHRAGIKRALNLTIDVARASEAEPVFSLTHVMSPHAPYAFGSHGELVEPLDCYPDSCTFWGGEWADLPGQLHHLNEMVLPVLRELIEARPEAVVILMSDHGSQPSSRPPEGNFQNLVAVRTPGIEGLVPPDISLVNLLPTVINRYLDADLAVRPHRAWISEADQPLTTTVFDR